MGWVSFNGHPLPRMVDLPTARPPPAHVPPAEPGTGRETVQLVGEPEGWARGAALWGKKLG